MLSRRKSASAKTPGPPGLSFIGTEVVVSGDVATAAQLHVDGRIEGNVRCGQLCQGASGTIAGDIQADEARIAGTVEGTVAAATVIVEASGRIAGDVAYETLSIAAGARIDGRLARREALAGREERLLVAASAESDPAKAADAPKPAGPHELFAMPAERQAAAG